MTGAGLVLRRDDPVARTVAKTLGLETQVSPGWTLPWARTVFVAPGAPIAWELLRFGLAFLAKWDAAAPLVEPVTLASTCVRASEYDRSRALLGDFRVPLLDPGELLFVRSTPAGQELVRLWRQECATVADQRLAFLHALWTVKPLFCALPWMWVADATIRKAREAGSVWPRRPHPLPPPPRPVVPRARRRTPIRRIPPRIPPR